MKKVKNLPSIGYVEEKKGSVDKRKEGAASYSCPAEGALVNVGEMDMIFPSDTL